MHDYVAAMATMTLDTLAISKRLQSAGFSVAQAEAVTAVVNEAGDPDARDLVTNKDLEIKLAPLRSDNVLIKWMLGAVLALVTALFLKQFLP